MQQRSSPELLRRESRPRWGRSDAWFIVGLLAAGVFLPLLTGALAGSLDVPRNDDWSYRRIATTLATTGKLEMDGAAETMLLGQILVTQPLLSLSNGASWAFTVAGVIFSAGAVVGAYVMARQILSPTRAGLAALLLLLFPGYLAYATSYMNDVPALAAQFITVAFGAIAVSRRPVRLRWLALAALIGCVAFSMRHFALAAPAAVLLVAICAERRNRRIWVIAFGTALVCLALQVFRSSLAGQLGEVDKDIGMATRLPPAIVTIAFVTLPAALVAVATSGSKWHRRDVRFGAIFGVGMVAIQIVRWAKFGTFPDALLHNLVTRWGTPDQYYVPGVRPILLADPLWLLFNIAALIAVLIVPPVIAGVIGMHLRRRQYSIRASLGADDSPLAMVAVFALLAAGSVAVFGLFWIVFDRYLWPIVPPLAAVLMVETPATAGARLKQGEPSRLYGAGVLAICALLATLALPLMANSNAFDAARWRAGTLLLSVGVPPDTIDAGYEWVGFHSTVQPRPADPVPARIWYLGWWPAFETCGLVSSSDLKPAEGTLIAVDHYPLYLIGGPAAPLYTYRINSLQCERAAAGS
jgi:hypothetical protein